MTQVLVNDASLYAIADAIRDKGDTSQTMRPSQMAEAILALPSGGTLGTKSISANGTYNASSDSLDGYSSVTVNVPNSYAAADEGKVVSDGALVAQTARASEITENGTYDTTTNDEVTVNVSGGGGGTPSLPSAYQEVAYLDFDGASYFNLDFPNKIGDIIEAYVELLTTPGVNNAFWGTQLHSTNTARVEMYFAASRSMLSGYIGGSRGTVCININNAYGGGGGGASNVSTGVKLYMSMQILNASTSPFILNACIGAHDNDSFYSQRLYRIKISNSQNFQTPVPEHEFVPCRRKSDNVIGVYDLYGETFYTNDGTGTLVAGPDVS